MDNEPSLLDKVSDAYDLLGLELFGVYTVQDINKKYKALAKTHHPDKAQDKE